MCVIIHLPKNKIINFDAFKKAALNNPHGWGVITRDDGVYDVRREYNPKGNDPEEIYTHILNNNDHERFVHVRYNTVGHSSVDNVHPFNVFDSKDRKINFMHNGTIHEYKPTTGSDKSDTRHYSESFLSPLLYHFSGEHGLGDYTDPFFRRLLGTTFQHTSKGLLVANDLDPLLLGYWSKYKDTITDEEFDVSNNDYFTAVQASRSSNVEARRSSAQGYTFRSDEGTSNVEKGKEGSPETAVTGKEQQSSDTSKGKEFTELKDVSFEKKAKGRLFRTSDLDGIWSFGVDSDFDQIDNEDLSYFKFLTKMELDPWITANPTRAGDFLNLFFERFSELFEEYNEIDTARVEAIQKHEKASKTISEMRKQINSLEAENNELRKALGVGKEVIVATNDKENEEEAEYGYN